MSESKKRMAKKTESSNAVVEVFLKFNIFSLITGRYEQNFANEGSRWFVPGCNFDLFTIAFLEGRGYMVNL